MTQRYPFAANSFTDIFGVYPILGKSSPQVLDISSEPIIETANIWIFIIAPRLSIGVGTPRTLFALWPVSGKRLDGRGDRDSHCSDVTG